MFPSVILAKLASMVHVQDFLFHFLDKISLGILTRIISDGTQLQQYYTKDECSKR